MHIISDEDASPNSELHLLGSINSWEVYEYEYVYECAREVYINEYVYEVVCEVYKTGICAKWLV